MIHFLVRGTTTHPLLEPARPGLGVPFSPNFYLLADPQHRNNPGFPRSSRPPNRNTLRNSGAMLRMASGRKPGVSGLWRRCGWWRDRGKILREGVLDVRLSGESSTPRGSPPIADEEH